MANFFFADKLIWKFVETFFIDILDALANNARERDMWRRASCTRMQRDNCDLNRIF